MIVALADTHGERDAHLTDHLRETLQTAEQVVHAGDFTTPAVLDRFEAVAGAFLAVHGNSDDAGVRSRLPAVATVEALGRRILVVHGDEHDRTSLPLLARQEGADLVVVGHTHRGDIDQIGDLPVVNPGSHADPRGTGQSYAVIDRDPGGAWVGLRSPSGEQSWAARL